MFCSVRIEELCEEADSIAQSTTDDTTADSIVS